jgi:hypothetical protein
VTCVNCEKPPVWVFKTSGVRDTLYCNPHLPSAYRGSRSVTPYEVPVAEAVVERSTVLEDEDHETPKRARKPRATKTADTESIEA